MVKLAIFASGSGSNAENIYNYFKGNPQVSISLILANKKDAFVFERAERLGIEAKYFPKSVFDQGDEILQLLKNKKIDYIILAGFLLKVSPVLLQAYENKIVNIHPALLPNYGGKGMYGMNVHQAVIANGESKSGITIHFVNENYDEGEIIFQASTDITEGDTAESLAQKIHELEYRYFPQIIESIVK